MKKSEFLKERREFILRQWGTAPRKDADAAIEGALRVAVNHAEAAGVEWDPEEPELPRWLTAYQTEGCGEEFNWHLGPGDGSLWAGTAHQGKAYGAAAAAYNREREEDAFEAENGAEFSAKVEEVCREQVDALVARKVQEERDRCERIIYALKTHYSAADAFEGRTPVRDLIEQHRLAIEQGTTHEQDLPPIESAWTGAGDLPNPAPPERWPGARALAEEALARQPMSEKEADAAAVDFIFNSPLGEEGARMVQPASWPDSLQRLRGWAGGYVLAARWEDAENDDEYGDLTAPQAEEAARRWEAEPKLRARIDRAVALARGSRGPTFGRVMDQVERILTGKES